MTPNEAAIHRAFVFGAYYALTQDSPLTKADAEKAATEYLSRLKLAAEPVPAVVAPEKRSAPKKRLSAASSRPAGWSEGAWQYHLAVRKASTYEALSAAKLRVAAMRGCDRAEGELPSNLAVSFVLSQADERQWGKPLFCADVRFLPVPKNAIEALPMLRKLGVMENQISWKGPERAKTVREKLEGK